MASGDRLSHCDECHALTRTQQLQGGRHHGRRLRPFCAAFFTHVLQDADPVSSSQGLVPSGFLDLTHMSPSQADARSESSGRVTFFPTEPGPVTAARVFTAEQLATLTREVYGAQSVEGKSYAEPTEEPTEDEWRRACDELGALVTAFI